MDVTTNHLSQVVDGSENIQIKDLPINGNHSINQLIVDDIELPYSSKDEEKKVTVDVDKHDKMDNVEKVHINKIDVQEHVNNELRISAATDVIETERHVLANGKVAEREEKVAEMS